MTAKMRCAYLLAISGLLLAMSALYATGCNHTDCADAHTCGSAAGVGGGGTGGTGGPGGAGGAGGGDAGASMICDPTGSINMAATSCGPYASFTKGNDMTGDGSPGNPYQTLTKAVGSLDPGQAYAGKTNVYACGETFTEAVFLLSDVTLYGALDCNSDWNYDSTTQTTLTAPTDMIPLTIEPTATSVSVHDFAITAADATTPSGSSIAVVVDGATATFTNCDLTAGTAADGAAGPDGLGDPSAAEAGGQGTNAGLTPPPAGGAGSTSICFGVTLVPGGTGGAGGTPSNGPGYPGMGGNVEDDGQGQQMGGTCSEGAPGVPGQAGPPGSSESGLGTVDVMGYHGISLLIMDGTNGTNGESGGGGGGSMAGATIYGAGGGGGGAGGCGGAGGKGGKPGGSSIALISLNATVMFEGVTSLMSAKGGDGGNGGSGQVLQEGGQGGLGGNSFETVGSACAGGKGGDGGNGGNGAGGDGGHSFGIVATGMINPTFKMMSVTVGVSGGAGMGGSGNADMNGGSAGMAGRCLNFDTNVPCM